MSDINPLIMLTFDTFFESVPHKSLETYTGGNVVYDGAGGVAAARARARVHARVGAVTGELAAAVRVEDALRPAAQPRVALEAGGAGAAAAALAGHGHGARAALVGVTRTRPVIWCYSYSISQLGGQLDHIFLVSRMTLNLDAFTG